MVQHMLSWFHGSCGVRADQMTKFKAAHPELRVEMPERMAYDGFAQLLRRTKLFVSPWGCAPPRVVACGSLKLRRQSG